MRCAGASPRWSGAISSCRCSGVRNIGGFNRKVKEADEAGKPIKDPIRMQKIAQGGSGRRRRGRADLDQPAVHRGHHRRTRRSDDDRRQESRGAHRAPGAKGARLGHSFDPRDAAAVGGRDHRTHQGEHSDAHRVPGVRQGGFAHHPRPERRRVAARATATCCICRRAPPSRRASTAPSSPIRRCTGWSPGSRPPSPPIYIDEILEGPRNADSRISLGR